MLRFYTKFFFLIFWTLQILQQTTLPINFKPILYLMIGFSLLFTTVLAFKDRYFLSNKGNIIIFLIILTYSLYWIVFDQSLFGLQYIASKIAIFGMIAATVYYNFDFVEKHFPPIMLSISLIVLVTGLITNHDFGTRYSGPFTNSNSLGFLSVLAFTLILFYLKPNVKKNILTIFIVILTLISGSRKALGGLVLVYIIKDGFSLKKVLALFAAIVVLFGINKVSTNYGFTTGIDRLISSSKKDDILAGRDMEFKLGILSIIDKPVEGHGLDHYAHLSDKIVAKSGVLRWDNNFASNPHNSFIALYIQLGIPFGIILFFILIYYLMKSVLYKPPNKLFLTLIIFPFLSGFFESNLFGINGYEGTTFWFSLIFYQFYMLQKNRKAES